VEEEEEDKEEEYEGEEDEEDQETRTRTRRTRLWTRRVRGRQGGGRGGEDFNQGSYEARPTRCRVAASLRPIDAGIGFRV
jgi:hypothetical protein